MKRDLDSLMQKFNLDAILITGPGQHNPAMVYMTGGAHLTGADLIVKRGEQPVLFYNPMERDEAAKSGLECRNLNDYRMMDLIKQAEGDVVQATATRYSRMLADLGITGGRLGLYGLKDAGSSYAVFSALKEMLPELEIASEMTAPVLMEAMATKDESEVARIRQMGKITTAVVGRVADFLISHPTRDEVLVKENGQPLTIGDVKAMINLWLAELGAENPEGTIFAIGRDAGVPHSSGNPTDIMRLGQTIVFDIFPCEAGGGYYYDFTRTWCLGYAPAEVQALYDNVKEVYQAVMDKLEVNAPFKDYQRLTCELFEAQGHPTIQTDPQILEGYVHSVGHGLGLHVHERPMSGSLASEADRLTPGVIVTVEPGLYYPSRGMGVRLEDTVWIDPDGKPVILAEYPLDLILPMRA